MKKNWVFIVAFIVLAAGGGYIIFNQTEKPTPPPAARNQESYLPAQTDPLAYNGTLFITSEKLGSEFDLDDYITDLNRNGVSQSIVYYGIEGGFFENSDKSIKGALTKYPGRIIPFYSTGIGSQSEGEMLGEELTGQYRKAYTQVSKKLGPVLAGVGEIEAYAWKVPHNDPKIRSLIDIAAENKMAVMFHPARGQSNEMADLLAGYPNTTFLIHLFRNDFTAERQLIHNLMTKYPNLVYTIDADHMMFSPNDKIGLLYKYQDQPLSSAVEGFTSDFDRQFKALLASSLEEYRPLIEAFPDRVTLGTESSLDYALEDAVFDRTIKLLRYFIAGLPESQREAVAFKNAKRYFSQAE